MKMQTNMIFHNWLHIFLLTNYSIDINNTPLVKVRSHRGLNVVSLDKIENSI